MRKNDLQKKCVFCHNAEPLTDTNNDNVLIYVDASDSSTPQIYGQDVDDDGTFGSGGINYCPICGRNLHEDGDAK